MQGALVSEKVTEGSWDSGVGSRIEPNGPDPRLTPHCDNKYFLSQSLHGNCGTQSNSNKLGGKQFSPCVRVMLVELHSIPAELPTCLQGYNVSNCSGVCPCIHRLTYRSR